MCLEVCKSRGMLSFSGSYTTGTEACLHDCLLSREHKLCGKFSKESENKVKEQAYNCRMGIPFIEPD